MEDKTHDDLPALLELTCKDVTGIQRTIEFRSPWINETNLWAEKLALLKEREVSDLLKAPVKSEGVVLALQPRLHLRDPDRMYGSEEASPRGSIPGRRSTRAS